MASGAGRRSAPAASAANPRPPPAPLFAAFSALGAGAQGRGCGLCGGAGCWNSVDLPEAEFPAAATYRSSARAKPRFWASCSRLTAVLPRRCSSFRPAPALRDALLQFDGVEPHADLERARGLARKPSCGLSQSRDGPPDLAEMISTVCPWTTWSAAAPSGHRRARAAAMPQVRVQVIGEVHRRGAGGQLDHARLGRHHVDALIALCRFGGSMTRLARAASSAWPVRRGRSHRGLIAGLDLAVPGQQLAHPRQLPVVCWTRRPARPWRRPLIAPVRDAVLANWCISRVRICTSKGRPSWSATTVQRAVAVGLGPRNIVVEFLGDGRPICAPCPAPYSSRARRRR